MSLTTLPKSATVEEAIAILERDGGVILADFADSATLAGLRADLDPYLNQGKFGQDVFSGRQTRRLGGLFAKTQHAIPLIEEPRFLGAAEHYLQRPTSSYVGDDRIELTPNFQIGVTQVIQIHPGEGSQALHRDDGVWAWPHPEGYRQARVQIMLAVTDFTADNGGTMVIPGSHRWDDHRAPTTAEAVPTEMTAGSALLWLGGTFHGGGTNRSDEPRTGITVTFDLGYLRQEENQYLAVPLDTVRSLPAHVQRLLGYQACPPLLGWVEIDGVMADPHTILEADGAAVSLMASH